MTKKATTGEKRSVRLRYAGYFVVCNALLLLCASIFSAFDTGAFGGCLIKKALHIYCPGCGGTRAMLSLLKFDLTSSLRQNPLVLLLLLIAIYYEAVALCVIVTGREPSNKVKKISATLPYIFVFTVIIYFAGRNIALIVWGIDPLGDIIGH